MAPYSIPSLEIFPQQEEQQEQRPRLRPVQRPFNGLLAPHDQFLGDPCPAFPARSVITFPWGPDQFGLYVGHTTNQFPTLVVDFRYEIPFLSCAEHPRVLTGTCECFVDIRPMTFSHWFHHNQSLLEVVCYPQPQDVRQVQLPPTSLTGAEEVHLRHLPLTPEEHETWINQPENADDLLPDLDDPDLFSSPPSPSFNGLGFREVHPPLDLLRLYDRVVLPQYNGDVPAFVAIPNLTT
jgi:hypothetical protein